MLHQALNVNSSSSYHRLMSTLSWVNDLCNLGGFPSFGPGVLQASGFNKSLLMYEKNRLWKAVVTPQASLPWPALPGEYCLLEKSHLGGSLSVIGIETKTVWVMSNEV